MHRPRRGRWFQISTPFDFEWNHAKLEIPNLPPQLVGLRIIHLTDLHVRGPWHEAYDCLLERIAQANADLLLFTGDFVDNKKDHSEALPSARRLAEGFRAKQGVYAILGNHDRLHFLPRLLEMPLQAICGERRTIAVNGATVELIGLPGAVRRDLPREFVSQMPPPPLSGDKTVRIVLSHFPDHLLRTAALRPHLFLAGHTHGGQCCLPGGIPILKHDSLPRRLCTGIHRVEDTWLVVGRGFGSTTLQLRIFCPPEVIEIELVRPGNLP
ncbi:metallophosphoesterase [Humisphaera borealis]|uniref:Metallophosphoesterase n=1 Tax=Humisphaera borealis TaxID=2807512 RepID=A0A7M2WS80_9BACT|nr:metallophosphoesterase [Humisphaera borealis]QOV88367.1 metallophosphoesterase [Humisphaera borealis]